MAKYLMPSQAQEVYQL